MIPVIESCSLVNNQDSEILVDKLGIYLNKHQDMIFPHKHNFFHFVVFLSGSGSHSIDFTRYAVQPWQVYFMVPGQVHTWDFDGNVDGYVVNFSKQYLQSFLLRADYLEKFSFFSGSANIGAKEIVKEIRDEVVLNCQKLYELVNKDADSSGDFSKVTLLGLLMLLEQGFGKAKSPTVLNHNFEILRDYQALIEENYSKLRLPKSYADLLFVTSIKLNSICKDLVGMQAGDVIRQRILLEAKRLLVSRDLTISQIAHELNFNDNSYFTKFFKKYSGKTPEDFKRQFIKD